MFKARSRRNAPRMIISTCGVSLTRLCLPNNPHKKNKHSLAKFSHFAFRSLIAAGLFDRSAFGRYFSCREIVSDVS
jgi:hypothetical protein